MLSKKILYLFCLTAFSSFAQSPCREVVGYYPGWQWYDRNKLVKPASIDYSQYSILQYAFMNVLSDGHLQITDPWGDKNLLLGDINWSVAPAGYDGAYDFGNSDYHISNTNLAYYAHLNDVKLLMSIGGWTQSLHFPAVAADAGKRANFIADCLSICELYTLDGIDIDWEYPATTGEGDDFLVLLQELRTALDGAESDLGRDLYLTAAVGANPAVMANIPWEGVSNTLDIINLMSYDFYGTWDPLLNHNSPLFAPASGDPDWNCAAAVQRLITQYNVPADKLTLGIAFYGRSQLSNTTPVLFGTGNGSSDYLHFGVDEGTPLYYNILLQENAFTAYWDDQAKVPYMISAENNSFLSYDNEESVTQKAQYIIDEGLRGAIIWEITGDYVETSPGSGVIAGTPLASAINATFCAEPNAVKESIGTLTMYPIPAEDFLMIKGFEKSPIQKPFITDLHGHTIPAEVQSMEDGYRIHTAALPSGIYLVRCGESVSRFLHL